MRKSVWEDVRRDDIIAAIRKFDKEKPNYHKPKEYYLLFEGNLYPSKHIRKMAYREVYPEGEIPNFTGGKRNTVPFFTNRNFEICRISKGTYIPEEVEDLNLKEQMNLIDDADLKEQYNTPIERPAAKTETHRQSYERNPKISKIALKNSGYKCEINPKHITFYRKSDGKPYVEPHHIIPMAKQDDFNYSLDIPQNIVSLCSNCHNEVHYGINGKSLIEKIYEKRKNELRNMHIEISLEKLLSYY